MKRLLLTILVLVPIANATATGRLTCEHVSADKWMSETALSEKLTAEGWTVRRMKEDGGCWEVYGTMPDGKRVEAYFHPATGETLLISQRGRTIFRAQGN